MDTIHVSGYILLSSLDVKGLCLEISGLNLIMVIASFSWVTLEKMINALLLSAFAHYDSPLLYAMPKINVPTKNVSPQCAPYK